MYGSLPKLNMLNITFGVEVVRPEGALPGDDPGGGGVDLPPPAPLHAAVAPAQQKVVLVPVAPRSSGNFRQALARDSHLLNNSFSYEVDE